MCLSRLDWRFTACKHPKRSLRAGRLHLCSQVLVRVIVLVIVLLCALVITKLSNISNQESTMLTWRGGALSASLRTAAEAAPGTLGPNTTASEVIAMAAAAPAQLCTAALAHMCTPALVSEYAAVGLNLTYGSLLGWANSTQRLLNDRPLRVQLQACAPPQGHAANATTASSCGPIQLCLPCYCHGLKARYSSTPPGAVERPHVDEYCAAYLDEYDLRYEVGLPRRPPTALARHGAGMLCTGSMCQAVHSNAARPRCGPAPPGPCTSTCHRC